MAGARRCAPPLARLLGVKVVLDTGDLAYALARSTGSHTGLGLLVVWLGERLTLALASHVIVRGRAHLEFVRGKPATFAPDLPPTARPWTRLHSGRSSA